MSRTEPTNGAEIESPPVRPVARPSIVRRRVDLVAIVAWAAVVGAVVTVLGAGLLRLGRQLMALGVLSLRDLWTALAVYVLLVAMPTAIGLALAWVLTGRSRRIGPVLAAGVAYGGAASLASHILVLEDSKMALGGGPVLTIFYGLVLAIIAGSFSGGIALLVLLVPRRFDVIEDVARPPVGGRRVALVGLALVLTVGIGATVRAFGVARGDPELRALLDTGRRVGTAMFNLVDEPTGARMTSAWESVGAVRAVPADARMAITVCVEPNPEPGQPMVQIQLGASRTGVFDWGDPVIVCDLDPAQSRRAARDDAALQAIIDAMVERARADGWSPTLPQPGRFGRFVRVEADLVWAVGDSLEK